MRVAYNRAMPPTISVDVRVVSPTGERLGAIAVAHATPVGAAWSFLIGDPDHVPPARVAYVLNGVATVPSAWLADGDELVVHVPEAP